jgi:hypothetical protein
MNVQIRNRAESRGRSAHRAEKADPQESVRGGSARNGVRLNFTIAEFPDHAASRPEPMPVSSMPVAFRSEIQRLLRICGRPRPPRLALHVIHGNRALYNVLDLQSVPAFDGATFQAASNFNSL